MSGQPPLLTPDPPALSSVKILLIEDDRDDVDFIKNMLDRVNNVRIELEHVDRLSTGLIRLAAGGIDVVLLDLSLPDSRGLETFLTTYAQAPAIPIVVMTGVNDEELAARALHQGAQDCLVKGDVNRGILTRSISYAIGRKQAEVALRESEKRLRDVLNHTTAIIYIKDTEGYYLNINRQYEALFHVKNEEVLGKSDFEIFPKEFAAAFVANDREVLRAGKPMEFEEVARHDDGLHTYISIKFPLFDTRGTPYAICGISTDITRRKSMEEDLRETQSRLAQAGKLAALGEMAAGIGHELNQPLEALQAYVDNMKILIKDKRYDEIRDNLDSISKLTRHTGKITSHIKSFARRKSKNAGPVNLQSAIDYTISFLVPPNKLEEIEIIKNFPEKEIVVRGDVVQFQQVFLNLMSNAFQAMTGFNPSQLYITIIQEGDWTILTFRDTGSGIPEEALDRVFDPFFTTRDKNEEQGLGLGLSISASLVKEFGGSIEAANHSQGGAVFTVKFPRIDSTQTGTQ